LLRLLREEEGVPRRVYGSDAQRALGGVFDRVRGCATAPALARVTAEKLPITAIVASHNEAALLSACLDGVSFCDEIVVIDIASSDDTAAVAEAHRARVVRHPWVPIAEQARLDVIRDARHDWLLIRDPDEVVPPPLVDDLRDLFPRIEPDVAVVAAPTQR